MSNDDADRTLAVDRVRDATDIVAVIGETVTLRRRGQKLWGLCPFHAEKSPSFSVDPARQLFYCFGCQVGGNVFMYVMRRDGKNFPEALEELADRAGIELPSRRRGTGGSRRAELLAVLAAAQAHFERTLRGADGEPGRSYLARRQIPPDVARDFGLGYAVAEWDAIVKALRADGFSAELVVAAGLAVERDRGGVYDRFRGRVTFPIRDPDGRVVGFGGRAIEDDATPKYLNSPETPVYHKGRILYGADRARAAWSSGRAPIVVEGYMDVLAFHRAGFPEAVGTLGTALTAEHARYLGRFTNRVVCAYDQDAAGQMGAQRGFIVLAGEGLEVWSLAYGAAKDADELLSTQGPAAVESAVQGAMPYLARRIKEDQSAVRAHPETKARAVRELLPLLDAMTDPVERAEYAALLQRSWGVEGGILSQRFRQAQGGKGNNSEKSRHNMRRSEVNLGPQDVEVNLLASLIQFPDGMEGVLKSVPELFRDSRWEAIHEEWSALANGEPLATWITRLPVDAADLVTAAAAVPWAATAEMVDQLARHVKADRTEREWQNLKAVADPDDPVVQAEIRQVFQEISARKRAPRREG